MYFSLSVANNVDIILMLFIKEFWLSTIWENDSQMRVGAMWPSLANEVWVRDMRTSVKHFTHLLVCDHSSSQHSSQPAVFQWVRTMRISAFEPLCQACMRVRKRTSLRSLRFEGYLSPHLKLFSPKQMSYCLSVYWYLLIKSLILYAWTASRCIFLFIKIYKLYNWSSG